MINPKKAAEMAATFANQSIQLAEKVVNTALQHKVAIGLLIFASTFEQASACRDMRGYLNCMTFCSASPDPLCGMRCYNHHCR